MLYTGIDLHKRTVALATVDSRGKVVAQASLATSRPELARYFRELPEPGQATVEATSCWYWLRDLLDAEQVPLPLAHANFVKAIAFSRPRSTRNKSSSSPIRSAASSGSCNPG